MCSFVDHHPTIELFGLIVRADCSVSRRIKQHDTKNSHTSRNLDSCLGKMSLLKSSLRVG
jgi:hypothetical protein